MSEPGDQKQRRTFKWSQAARQAVRANLNARGAEKRELITKLARESGNPRDACLRFARKLGLTTKRPYRSWSAREQRDLLQLVGDYPIRTAAQKFGRDPAAIYGMLRRLGATATMRKGQPYDVRSGRTPPYTRTQSSRVD